MDKRIGAWVGIALVATLLAGPFSFYMAGGISALASDVGESGAWFLLFFINLLYGALSVVGLLFSLLILKNLPVPLPNSLQVVASAAIIAASINLYGVLSSSPALDLAWFILLVIAFSTFVYTAAAVVQCILVSSDAG